jgi:hypothetical protein
MNKDTKPHQRIFLIDYGITVSHGHNVNFLSKFMSLTSQQYSEFYIICPSTADFSSCKFEEGVRLVPNLTDVFGFDLGVPPSVYHDHSLFRFPKYSRICYEIFRKFTNAFKVRNLKIFRRIELLFNWIHNRQMVKADLSWFFSNFDVTPNDIILLPSSEYLSLEILLKYLKRLNFNLKVRFVGGLENSPLSRISEKWMKLQTISLNHPKIFLSTETKKYTDYLAANWAVPASQSFITYYPFSRIDPIRQNLLKTVGLVGYPRLEKGVEDYPAIVAVILQKTEFSVVVQPLDSQIPILELLTSLYPGRVTLIKGNLSNGTFDEVLSSVDVMIFNYIPDLYFYRNSALISDALGDQKLLLCRAGSAVADEILSNDLGLTFNNIDEIPNLLDSFSKTIVAKFFPATIVDFQRKLTDDWLRFLAESRAR